MKKQMLFIVMLWIPQWIIASNLPLTLFPIEDYDQHINTWINPNDPQNHQRLVSKRYQQKRLHNLYQHMFGKYSPWSVKHYQFFASQLPKIKKDQQLMFKQFMHPDSKNAILYSVNYRLQSHHWFSKYQQQYPWQQLNDAIPFNPNRRAIVVHNTYARALPTNLPSFYHYTIPGEGYPFDNLQASALWIGTPLYIVAYNKNHTWAFVMTASYMAWVACEDIALANDAFIHHWRQLAKQHLIAIIHTRTSLHISHQPLALTAYVGTILPATGGDHHMKEHIWLPSKNALGYAIMIVANASEQDFVYMPWAATKDNFAKLFKTLIGRPYGWGGQYFNNDCSQELRSLYAPFGIWLARNSSKSILSGHLLDLSNKSAAERIKYLARHGHPFMSIVTITGHVFMYIGNYKSVATANQMWPMTYQNLWGFKTKKNISRAVIGKAVFLPLLSHYPENSAWLSLASKSEFKVSNLDSMPDKGSEKLLTYY